MKNKINITIDEIEVEINLRFNPYRGVISEIAREQKVSRQAIRQAIVIWNNTRILTIFRDKVIERRNGYESVRIR